MLPGWTRAWWLAETALDLLGPIFDSLRRRGGSADEEEEPAREVDWSEVTAEVTLIRVGGVWFARAPSELYGAVGPCPTPWDALAALVIAALREDTLEIE